MSEWNSSLEIGGQKFCTDEKLKANVNSWLINLVGESFEEVMGKLVPIENIKCQTEKAIMLKNGWVVK